MDGIIKIFCPPMLVSNTGWLPRSDREAQELPCTGFVQLNNSLPIDLINFRFPKCRVYNVAIGRWMVEPVVAFGDNIKIDYPQEPIKRRGELMIAQPIQNNVAKSIIRLHGVAFTIDAPLPEAIGRPGAFFGLFSYLVDAVIIRGTIKRV